MERDTEFLLQRLKNEGKIQAFQMQGLKEDPQAEVILNGGLVNMTKFARQQKKFGEDHGLSRVTEKLLHEQIARSTFVAQGGGERALSSQRSPTRDQRKSAGIDVGPEVSPMDGNESDQGHHTFNDQSSPFKKVNPNNFVADDEQQQTQKHLNLDQIKLLSDQRKEDELRKSVEGAKRSESANAMQ